MARTAVLQDAQACACNCPIHAVCILPDFPCRIDFKLQAFVCDPIGETSYLKADYFIECGSGAHATIVRWAILAILIYPVSVPSVYAILLFKVRYQVLNSENSDLSEALVFLHRLFKPPFFWWDIVNVLQKLVLVGFFVLQLFHPDSFTQLVLGMTVALLFAFLQMQVQPYRRRFDNLLAGSSSISLALFFIGAVLYRVFELTVGFESVKAQLSGEWASRRFMISFSFISVLMFLSAFGSIIALVVLYGIEMITVKLPPTILLRSTGCEPELSLPEHPVQAKFHGFISHGECSSNLF